jgi:hypothetical protein
MIIKVICGSAVAVRLRMGGVNKFNVSWQEQQHAGSDNQHMSRSGQ